MRLNIVVFLLFPLFVAGQDEKPEILNPEGLGVTEFKLGVNETATQDIKLPFSSIKILDSRFDTSKIGFVYSNEVGGKRKAFKKMTFQGGQSNAIESYYNEYYANAFTGNEFELLIVMKRFWIGQGIKNSSKRVEIANSVEGSNNLYCKWEYYLGKGGAYLPIKRVDTVIWVPKNGEGVRKNYDDKKLYHLRNALNELIEMFSYTNAVNSYNENKKKTLTEIQKYNNQRNDIPVLQANTIKKGVYLTFEEFKNNKPSITEFREKKMRYGRVNQHTEIYLETMDGKTISDYWGYSDGDICRYGMLGNEKIFKVQNTFCFFIKVVGYVIDQGNEGAYGGSGVNTTSKSRYQVWVPFQIDWESGQIL